MDKKEMKRKQRALEDSSLEERLMAMYAPGRDVPEVVRRRIAETLAKEMEEDEMKIKEIPVRCRKRTIAVIAAAAALAVAGSAIAAIHFSKLTVENKGTYGRELAVVTEAPETVSEAVPYVKALAGYIPEGMAVTWEGKSSLYDPENPGQGGITFRLFRMDQGDAAFQTYEGAVLDEEAISADTHEGVYFRLNTMDMPHSGVAFGQRIYLYYPELHYVMLLYVSDNMAKEEAVKVAENLELIPVESEAEALFAQDWSDYQEAERQASKQPDEARQKEDVYTVTRMGESVSDLTLARADGALTHTSEMVSMRITDVAVLDEIPDEIASQDRGFREAADSEGRLKNDTVSYIAYGDGENTVDEVAFQREVPLKLVMVTLEYRNDSGRDLAHVVYNHDLRLLEEENGALLPYEESSREDISFDACQRLYARTYMRYYAPQAEMGKNYIDSLPAGSGAYVTVGYLVDEDQLPYLYMIMASEYNEAGEPEKMVLQKLVP